MINKFVSSVAEALAGTADGATVMIGGFGTAGIPDELIEGLLAQGARDLTLVNNNAGNAEHGLAARKTVATVHEQVALGELDPETVVTPGIFVQAVVKTDRVATQAGGIKA